MNERMKILEMLENGTITATEASSLLDAIEESEALKKEKPTVKATLEKTKEALKKGYHSLEEAELRVSKKIIENPAWKKIGDELAAAKEEIKKSLNKLDESKSVSSDSDAKEPEYVEPDVVGANKMEEAIDSLSEKIENLSEKMKGWFK